jgi:hypothetical protein
MKISNQKKRLILDAFCVSICCALFVLLIIICAFNCHSETSEQRQYQDSIKQAKIDSAEEQNYLNNLNAADSPQFNEDIPH